MQEAVTYVQKPVYLGMIAGREELLKQSLSPITIAHFTVTLSATWYVSRELVKELDTERWTHEQEHVLYNNARRTWFKLVMNKLQPTLKAVHAKMGTKIERGALWAYSNVVRTCRFFIQIQTGCPTNILSEDTFRKWPILQLSHRIGSLPTRGHAYKLYKSRSSNVRVNFFACRVVNVWNSLPNTVAFTSLAVFKRCIRTVDFSEFFYV